MTDNSNSIRVDIVSDVVCPWCIVGYKQLMNAADQSGIEVDVHWHPFELNIYMPEEGQDLREHVLEKYGSSREESDASRERFNDIGKTIDFDFNFSDDSRIVNTFRAHQLMQWADTFGKKNELKQRLFVAHFTEQLNVNDAEVLVSMAADIGLDKTEATAVLNDERFAETVREAEELWQNRGVTGVPAMVFEQKYLVTGAQGEESYTNVLSKVVAEKAAA